MHIRYLSSFAFYPTGETRLLHRGRTFLCDPSVSGVGKTSVAREVTPHRVRPHLRACVKSLLVLLLRHADSPPQERYRRTRRELRHTDPLTCSAVLAELRTEGYGLASVVLGAGQHQQAGAVADTITNPYWQAHALGNVAGALALAGQLRQAEAVARAITDPAWQAGVLAEVAGALAQAGQHQQAAAIAAQAEAAARTIADPGSEASALAKVAGALAQAGEARSAARMAAAVCAAATWPTAVTPVLLLVPSAFTTLTCVLKEQVTTDTAATAYSPERPNLHPPIGTT
jgi:hypothetical protein